MGTLAAMVFCSSAVENVPLQQRKGQPLNSEYNRNQLSAFYAVDGDAGMTPVMCGFYLQAMVMDRTSDAFQKLQHVAARTFATYEENGMERHLAMCMSMRVKLESDSFQHYGDRVKSFLSYSKWTRQLLRQS